MKKDKEIDWKDQCKSLKKYRKENPVKKSSYGIKKGRTKKDPITINSYLTDYHKNIKKEDAIINLTITATPDNWRKLADYLNGNLEVEFWNRFINPALAECNKKTPRGKNKAPTRFTQKLKIEAGTLYAFLSYWCKKPLTEWPVYFRNLEIDSDSRKKLEEENPINPVAFTAYCLEMVYSKELKCYGIKPFFANYENFYYTYIHGNQRLSKRFTKEYIENKKPNEVEQLVYTIPALNKIFSALKVI